MIRTVYFLTLLLSFSSSAQISGNHVLNIHKATGTVLPPIQNLALTDSTFFVQAKVMSNVLADQYIATFGVSDQSTTLKEAIAKVDDRIHQFIIGLEKMGIDGSDIHVDMTTQTQIRDYKVEGDYAEQYISGFEQKKNVIIRFESIRMLDKIVLLASDFEIYDLAKVEYHVDDISAVYNQLFDEALAIVNAKKDRYIQATNTKLERSSMVYGESFVSIPPSELYKSYHTNISTVYSGYHSHSLRKDLGATTTFYYDKLSYSGFDKVLNPHEIKPAIEYILVLQLRFEVQD